MHSKPDNQISFEDQIYSFCCPTGYYSNGQHASETNPMPVINMSI